MTTSALSRRGVLVFRKDDINVFLILVSLIGTYMQFHLYVGERIAFPFLFPNLIGIAAFIYYALKRQFLPALTAVILLVLFALVAVMMAAFDGYLGGALSKYSQLLLSIFAGYGLCWLILQIPRERLRKLLARLAWVILIVAFAETYLGFYEVMTQINTVLYSWRPQGFYTSVERDIALWNRVRPLVFSTEPSLVGIWGSVLMVGATILSPSDHWKRYLVLIAYVGVLLFIARSISVIPILVTYLGATMFYKRNSQSKQIMLFYGLIAVAWILSFTSALMLIGRFLQDTSFFVRFTVPYLTTLQALDRSLFFGLGLGNDDLFEVIVFDVWAQAGMLVRSAVYVEQYGLNGMLTNSFFSIWINLGMVGGVSFLAVVFGFVRQIGRFPAMMVLTTTFGTWMTVGGFVDMRTWFFLYFFIACAMSVERDKTNAA